MVNLVSPRPLHLSFACKASSRGFSLIETVFVAAIALVLMTIVMPNFLGLMQSYRRDAALQQIVGDVRKAREEAIRTGWQYRIFGFNAGASSSYKNQYRLQGRSSGVVAWPGDTAAPFQSGTQMAGPWVDIDAMFSGVTLNPTDGTERFWVAFDSRGVRIELDPSFNPLVIVNQPGSEKSVSVAAVGSVRVQ